MTIKEACEFSDCEEKAVVYNEELDAYLCQEHDNIAYDRTGYCPRSCQLGYGCDQSC